MALMDEDPDVFDMGHEDCEICEEGRLQEAETHVDAPNRDTFDDIVARVLGGGWKIKLTIADYARPDVKTVIDAAVTDPDGYLWYLVIDHENPTASLSGELDRVMHEYDVQEPDRVGEQEDD